VGGLQILERTCQLTVWRTSRLVSIIAETDLRTMVGIKTFSLLLIKLQRQVKAPP
jgi:hypothetical protein